ncbi:MAG TPA: oxidoreductase C-terminal domain-containing protein [Pseudonocardiaceae bacterium]|nr:oxidoreductase C-terminal domain-containing protein [Pseudonocardiaceae bacterium]
MPSFWSNQFGVNVKSVGLPTAADEVLITQGSPAARKFAAAYGRQGRIVGAVAVDSPRILEGYSALIDARTEFPPVLNATDAPADLTPLPAGFSHQAPAPISAQH